MAQSVGFDRFSSKFSIFEIFQNWHRRTIPHDKRCRFSLQKICVPVMDIFYKFRKNRKNGENDRKQHNSVPCLALPCLALPSLALPCLALPCLAFPGLALPCLSLPCFATQKPLWWLARLTSSHQPSSVELRHRRSWELRGSSELQNGGLRALKEAWMTTS